MPSYRPALKSLVSQAVALTLMVSAGLALTGCGGSGNSSGSNQPTASQPTNTSNSVFDPPALPAISADDAANTAEFRANYGLRSLNAHSTYAQGYNQAGRITVAIIDDGIDIDHSDLRGNISSLSVDIRTGQFADIDSQEYHGTQIAGIIAAQKNDLGVHGVAYFADLMVLKILDQGDASVTDFVSAIDYAHQNDADILNLSLTLPNEVRQALDRAVQAGMLIVISAGNNLPSNPAIRELDVMSSYATLPSANGQAIAVGAIDDDNELFALSNRPGSAGAEFYVLAPGVNIISTTINDEVSRLIPSSSGDFPDIDLTGRGEHERTEQLIGLGVLHAQAGTDGRVGDGFGDMAFASAGRADQDGVFPFGDELQGVEFEAGALGDFGVEAPVELRQRGALVEARLLVALFNLPRLAAVQLVLQDR